MSEAPFAIAQIAVLAVFCALGYLALRRVSWRWRGGVIARKREG
jgi:hypothetical protein